MHWADGAEQLHEEYRRNYLSGSFQIRKSTRLRSALRCGRSRNYAPNSRLARQLRVVPRAHGRAPEGTGKTHEFLAGDLARTFATRGIGLDEVANETFLPAGNL